MLNNGAIGKIDAGKVGGYSDLPLLALQEVTKRMQENRVKYPRGSHTVPMRNTDLIDAIFRHLIAYCNGEDIDTGTTTSHIVAIACNCLMIEEQRLLGTLIENRLSKELECADVVSMIDTNEVKEDINKLKQL